jgi:hypothetical protein
MNTDYKELFVDYKILLEKLIGYLQTYEGCILEIPGILNEFSEEEREEIRRITNGYI